MYTGENTKTEVRQIYRSSMRLYRRYEVQCLGWNTIRWSSVGVARQQKNLLLLPRLLSGEAEKHSAARASSSAPPPPPPPHTHTHTTTPLRGLSAIYVLGSTLVHSFQTRLSRDVRTTIAFVSTNASHEKNAAPQVQVFRLPMHTPWNDGFRFANEGAGARLSSATSKASALDGKNKSTSLARACAHTHTHTHTYASKSALCCANDGGSANNSMYLR